jgi:hypothetical protein
MDAALMLSVIESEMLANLVTLLVSGGKNPDDAIWQLEKLQQLGLLRSMNIKTVTEGRAKLLKAARAEIEKEALKRANMVDDVTAGAGKKLSEVMAPEATPYITAIVDKWEKAVANKLDKAFAPMIEKAGGIYTDTIYKAVAKHQMGVSGRTAIAEACTEWSKQGLTALVDSAGREWTPEAYAQMVIRTNGTMCATETQFSRMEELGEDLVEISSHLGARPKCEPYQGKIYSLSGTSKNYPALSTTSYGVLDGLFGCNCRHTMYPYFPGTEKTYQPQDKKENAESYKLSQQQRSIERDIRQSGRNYDLMKKTKDPKMIELAYKDLQDKESAMKSFIAETGRTRRYEREEVYGS